MLHPCTWPGTETATAKPLIRVHAQAQAQAQHAYALLPVAPAYALAAAPAIRRFGFLGTTWFPPDRTVRAGVVGYRVFVDVRDMLATVTTSAAAVRLFFVSWFDGQNLENTLARFGVDHSHYLLRCTWGGQREERCACSLHLALVVLRHSGVDLNVKLAAELESRLGLGLDLEMPGTKFHCSTNEVAASLAEIKASVEALKTKVDADVRVADATPIEGVELQRAKHEAAMAVCQFEKENPQRAFKERYEVLKEQIARAAEAEDVEWLDRLRGVLTKLILG